MKRLTDGKKTTAKSKRIIKSRQILVGALAVMVAVAGYYRYSMSGVGVETEEVVPVMNTVKLENESYFASARKERDSARSRAEELIRKIAEDDGATADAKADANAKLKKSAENIKAEGEIESFIKTKGYEDCIVFIDEEEVRVVVKAEKLEDDKVMQISDIVVSRTKFKPYQVVISNHK